MAFPQPPPIVLTASNPIEAFIASFNTNSYFIGTMMIILNLGGRHLVSGLTSEQDKFFQNPWFRRFLLFVVIFIATRNIFAALWLSIAVIVILGYLTNETSSLYLFGDPVLPPTPTPAPLGLSPEETEIYKRLNDRVIKAKEKEAKDKESDVVNTNTDVFFSSYMETMRNIQSAV
jgi:hypothetical protein